MTEEYIPHQWIQTKELRRDIQSAVHKIIEDKKHEGVSYQQVLAALTQVTANFAAQSCVVTIRGNKKGMVFHLPV